MRKSLVSLLRGGTPLSPDGPFVRGYGPGETYPEWLARFKAEKKERLKRQDEEARKRRQNDET